MEFIDFRLPAEGFAQPLMLWMACHQRGQRVALLLQRLFAHLSEHGPSDATRVTSAEITRYLNEAAPRHHADEDVDLFPRLRQRMDAYAGPLPVIGAAADALDRLAHDHAQFEDLWGRVRAALRHADQARPSADHLACVEQFVGSFIHHHQAEDQTIGQAAPLLLQPQDLAEIGAAMAARRGTTWAALSTPNGRA